LYSGKSGVFSHPNIRSDIAKNKNVFFIFIFNLIINLIVFGKPMEKHFHPYPMP